MNQAEAIESGLSIIRKSELDNPLYRAPKELDEFKEYLRTQIFLDPDLLDSGTFYMLYQEYKDTDDFLIYQCRGIEPRHLPYI